MARHTAHTKKSSVSWLVVGIAAVLFITAVTLLYMLLFRIPIMHTSYCANTISCVKGLTGMPVEGKVSSFMGHDISVPESILSLSVPRKVLGDMTGEKHIYVDLSTQMLSAYQGKTQVMAFPVSTGWWHETPTGDFRIWVKLRYAHMEGGNKNDGTYYNLYNVPYVMFYYNDDVPKSLGFSLHGAYWHNNFGHPMSHGCVNIRPEDAGRLYEWASPETNGKITYATETDRGTLVTITGKTPEE